MPRIVAIADTHGDHRDAVVPDGDVFIHAGDFLNFGQEKMHAFGDMLGDFYKWLEHLPHKHKILVAGNHDWFLNYEPKRIKELPCTYLQDSSIEIDGFKFYGSPWVPYIMGIGVFGVKPGNDMIEKWSFAPDDIDVLITHSAPLGLGDQCAGGVQHIGCQDLFNRVGEIKPRLHIFGHVHASGGFNEELNGTRFLNVSYNTRNKNATVIDL